MKYDVAIIGGGFAGQLLARQLTRTEPDLKIGIFERSTETSFKVGESIVEIGSNYLVRRQGLQRYLYDQHYPKNGLRYFFDRETQDAPLEEMSEIGPINLPFHPSFQIDRARIEHDLIEMNREAGIDVRLGVTVRATDVRDDGATHTLVLESEGTSEEIQATWVVDAAGRADVLARAKGLRRREDVHRIGSVWGRFENVLDIDSYGSEEFRARVRHSIRGLSTMHFWYKGYWIWFIPLRDGITSVGVVGDIANHAKGIRSTEGFRDFLMTHGAIATLLRDAKAVDVGSYKQVAYGTERFFHTGRWAVIGEAATAIDPLYSPGTDMIALANDFATDLITRDFRGESPAEWSNRCDLFDGFMQFRQEAALRLYRDQYETFGSYELTRAKWDLDIASYFNLWVSAYMQDEHLTERWLRRQLRLQPFVLNALKGFGDLFREVADHLEGSQDFYRANTGTFSYGLENIQFIPEVGGRRSRRAVLDKQAEIFNTVRASCMVLLGKAECPTMVEPLPLTAFLGEDSFV